MINLELKRTQRFLTAQSYETIQEQGQLAFDQVVKQSGAGSDYMGWVDWTEHLDQQELNRIEACAQRIRQNSDVLIVAGIGGSYLGARSVIDALSPLYETETNRRKRGVPDIIYSGNSLSPEALEGILEAVKDRQVSVNVISKSGNTTETAVAFRILRTFMESKYGEKEAAQRIIATTDQARGSLRKLAGDKGYETFVIPDNVGGRYSVLTAVGLLPIAVAGLDIRALLEGARQQRSHILKTGLRSEAAQYALTRILLMRKGYDIEVLASYEPALLMVHEWWKQLYGESEGKEGKGLFPASVSYTTDLHSMGQYVQDGRRILFETVLAIEKTSSELTIPVQKGATDGLDYLDGQPLWEVKQKAMMGTALAHEDGGVPNLLIRLEQLDEMNLGELIYFFEFACALSGYLNAINPFNQPGVEAYKNNMYALLGKPGYEALKKELEERL